MTTKELMELFKRYKFVSYNWSDEYSHECEVAMLFDVPRALPGAKAEQLAKAVAGTNTVLAGEIVYLLNEIRKWSDFENFDPGTIPVNLPPDQRENNHRIYVMPFMVWADKYSAFSRMLSGAGDDFEDGSDQ